MSNKTKSTRDAKVSIPIVGEEERPHGLNSESQKKIINFPNLDSSTLNNILIGAVSPIVVLVGGLYFFGMAANFILYPFRFILKFLSVLYSILIFLF